MVGEGFSSARPDNKYLLDWLEFELDESELIDLPSPVLPRLTFQVRQESIF